MNLTPAAVFPVAVHLRDELAERRWTTHILAERMGGDPAVDELAIDLLLELPECDLILDAETAAGLGRALGTSAQLWLNIDTSWRSGTPEQRALGLA